MPGVTGLIVTPEIDTSGAKKSFEDLLTSAGQDIDTLAGKQGAVTRELMSSERAARETAEAVKKINLRDALEKGVDKIGDFKDILQTVGKEAGFLSDKTVDSIGRVGDLAEKGASLGSAFGPWGAIIGAGVGALAEGGILLKEYLDATERATRPATELEKSFFRIKDWVGQAADSAWDQLSAMLRQTDVAMQLEDLLRLPEDPKVLKAALEAELSRLEKQAESFVSFQQMGIVLSKESEAQSRAILTRLPAVRAELEAAKRAAEGAAAATKSLRLELVQIPSEDKEARTRDIDSAVQAQHDEDLAANEAFEVALFNSKEQWRLKEIEEVLAFNASIEVIERQRLDTTLEILDLQAKKSREVSDQLKAQTIDLGAAVASSLGGQAVEGIDAFYDAWASGERRSIEDRKRARAEFLRDLGTRLMADGASHIAMGGVKTVVPLTRSVGFAEIAGGAGEVVLGASLGGTGAFAQRRIGGIGGTESSTPSRGEASSMGGSQGPQVNAPIVVNFPSVVPPSEREAQEVGSKLAGFLQRFRRQ